MYDRVSAGQSVVLKCAVVSRESLSSLSLGTQGNAGGDERDRTRGLVRTTAARVGEENENGTLKSLLMLTICVVRTGFNFFDPAPSAPPRPLPFYYVLLADSCLLR